MNNTARAYIVVVRIGMPGKQNFDEPHEVLAYDLLEAMQQVSVAITAKYGSDVKLVGIRSVSAKPSYSAVDAMVARVMDQVRTLKPDEKDGDK